jgi:hypothetical protein
MLMLRVWPLFAYAETEKIAELLEDIVNSDPAARFSSMYA